MFFIRIDYIIVLFLSFKVSIPKQYRKVQGGITVKADKGYMVLLTPGPHSMVFNVHFKCGGALVTPRAIVTSATCLEEAKYLYATIGSNFQTKMNYKENQCYEKSKKKIIETFIPKEYNFSQAVENWTYIDIGVAKVAKPWDMTTIPDGCQFKPRLITLNFESKYQKSGTDAIIYGFGSRKNCRGGYNVTIQYAPVLIADKEVCKAAYTKYAKFVETIDKYMLCTVYKGNIDYEGHLIVTSKPNVTCLGGTLRSDRTDHYSRNTYNMNVRRASTCQNNHGDPLVTYVGKNEVLIGVASINRLRPRENTSLFDCAPLCFYTSIQCNSAFLMCALQGNTNISGGSAICNAPAKVKGFHIVQQRIFWRKYTRGRNRTAKGRIRNPK